MGPLKRAWSAACFALMALVCVPSVVQGQESPVTCPGEPTNMAVAYGALVSCAIETTGDTDTFTFTGAVGEAVIVHVTRAPSASLIPCVDLVAPDASTTTSCNFSAANRIDTVLTQNGTFTIIARGQSAATGGYGLSLERVRPPSSSARPIEFGQTLQDSVDAPADLDLFTFTATAGDSVMVVGVRRSGSAVVPCLSLVAPDNTRQSACNFAAANRIDALLTQSGTYTIVFADSSTAVTGPYAVTLERLTPPSTAARPIVYGETQQDQIDAEGDVDTFSFSGSANDVIWITGTRLSGSPVVPCLQLVAPDNTRLSACNFSAANRIATTLTQTGVFTIVQSDSSYAQIGGYAIDLQCLQGSCLSTSGPRAIAYGETLQDTINAVADTDAFTFTAAAGDSVMVLGVRRAGSPIVPCLELIGPANTRFTACNFSSANRIDALLTQSGTYTIALGDSATSLIGPYTVTLERVTPPSSAARPIAYGETLQDQIDIEGDADTFSFTGSANDVIWITGTRLSGSPVVPCLQLVAPDNSRVAACNFSAANRISTTLTQSGVYTILQMDSALAQIGGYAVELQCLQGACLSVSGPRPIAYGETLQDTVNVVADTDTFTFTAAAGDAVMVLGVRRAGSPIVPCLELISPSNTRQSACNFSSANRIDALLTQGGTYTIAIGDSSTALVGPYTVTLERLAPPSNAARPIAYGETLQDQIDIEGDADTFSFTGSTNDVIWITGTRLSGSPVVPCLQLVAPDNSRVTACNFSAANRISTTLTQSGVFTIVQMDSSLAQMGGYAIDLQCLQGSCLATSGARAIAYGETLQDTLNAAADTDAFTFTAAAGDAVMVLGVRRAGSPVIPCLELVGPDNTRHSACNVAAANRIDALLTLGGTYTIVFLDASTAFTGPYTVTLERLTPPSGAARPMTYGATLQDQIDIEGDADTFSFSGTANDAISITATRATGGAVNPCLELVAPNNTRVRACNAGASNRIQTTLLQTGLFTILHVDAALAATGGYAVALQCITGNCPVTSPLPGPPTNLTGSSNGNTVQLSWGAPIVGAALTSYVLEAGRTSGGTDIVTADTGSTATAFTATGVPNGVYFIRVRARNAVGVSGPSNEARLVVGPEPCSAPPGAPSALAGTVVGAAVSLAWTAGTGILTSYRIEVGTSSGTSNITIVNTGNTQTTLTVNAPNGVYFVRVRATNDCGSSAPTNEARIVVGPEPCTAPPSAPGGLTANVSGLRVSLAWTGSTGGPVTYLLEAGSSAGSADLGVIDLGDLRTTFETLAPAGTYFVRVRARNQCGVGSPSNELTVVVR